MTTLAELITPVTASDEKAKLLAALASADFPVSDWETGAIERTHVEVEAAELADLSTVIPEIAKGGFLGEATGDWLTLRASDLYGLTRQAATKTTGSIVLSCVAAAGPYTITAGQLWFVGAGGNRYVNTSGGTLSAGGTLTVSVASEFANDSAGGYSYTDGANTITALETPLPGVTCTNSAAAFSAVTLVGTSSGTVAPSGFASGTHLIEMEILTSGQVGAGTWRYRPNGSSWYPTTTIGTIVNMAGAGFTLTPSNGGSSPSFLAGDRFLFSFPGSWITVQGTDAESDAALALRCMQRWPSLSLVPTDDCYSLWAKTASVEITRTQVILDGVVAGKVWIYVAGQGGALGSQPIADAQVYIDARCPITDLPVVASVGTTTITLAGTVTVQAALLVDAQVEAQRKVAAYLSGLDIAAMVRWGELVELIMSCAGVVDVIGFTLNGSAASLQLASAKVAEWTQVLSSVLTWVRA